MANLIGKRVGARNRVTELRESILAGELGGSDEAPGWAVSIPPSATAPQATDRPNASFAPPSGRLYFRPFRALHRTYGQIGVLVTTAGTGTVRLAIFARSANGSVGELLLDCGSVSPTAIGPVWSTINWSPSQPDVYLAVVCQGPGPLQVRCANGSALVASNGVIQASDGTNGGNYFQENVAGSIPAVPNPGSYATSGAPTIVIA